MGLGRAGHAGMFASTTEMIIAIRPGAIGQLWSSLGFSSHRDQNLEELRPRDRGENPFDPNAGFKERCLVCRSSESVVRIIRCDSLFHSTFCGDSTNPSVFHASNSVTLMVDSRSPRSLHPLPQWTIASDKPEIPLHTIQTRSTDCGSTGYEAGFSPRPAQSSSSYSGRVARRLCHSLPQEALHGDFPFLCAPFFSVSLSGGGGAAAPPILRQ